MNNSFISKSNMENLQQLPSTNISALVSEMIYPLINESESVMLNYNDSTMGEPEIKEVIGEENQNTVIAMTIMYLTISVLGLIGNVVTCIVISRNRVMHTATNYYLFSMAISDLVLLITGMPNEMHTLWKPVPYLFGEVVCVIRGLAAETSTNASILTICAFTIERYIGICHPLKSHKLSDLGRVVRFIIFIWLISLLSAFPLAVQYGIIYNKNNDPSSAQCNLKNFYKVLFEISTFVFFCTPMFLLLILYVKIGMELHRSANMARSKSIGSVPSSSSHERSRNKAVIKMLVAVVIAFFICWAPFHAQRLLSIYGDGRCKITKEIFMFLTHISGIFYYLSTCINPILYHIMSNRFRNALKATVHGCLCTSITHL
ncbi:unnamed protein product, partial [Meganyctiphanes norvegica]